MFWILNFYSHDESISHYTCCSATLPRSQACTSIYGSRHTPHLRTPHTCTLEVYSPPPHLSWHQFIIAISAIFGLMGKEYQFMSTNIWKLISRVKKKQKQAKKQNNPPQLVCVTIYLYIFLQQTELAYP